MSIQKHSPKWICLNLIFNLVIDINLLDFVNLRFI